MSLRRSRSSASPYQQINTFRVDWNPYEPFKRIVPDCLTVIFSYLTLSIHRNTSAYSEQEIRFLAQCAKSLVFGRFVDVSAFLGELYHGKVPNYLHYLNIDLNNSIKTEDFRYFKNLRELSMSGVKCVENEAFRHLGRIQSLNISTCPQLSDDAFEYLAQARKTGEDNTESNSRLGISPIRDLHLNMTGCCEFTAKGLRHLSHCLKSINSNGCTQFDAAMLKCCAGVTSFQMMVFPGGAIPSHEAFESLRGAKSVTFLDAQLSDKKVIWYLKGVEYLDIFACGFRMLPEDLPQLKECFCNLKTLRARDAFMEDEDAKLELVKFVNSRGGIAAIGYNQVKNLDTRHCD